jgi:Uma2 family endonuclease
MAFDPAARRATFADLASVPAHRVGEIIDGVLISSPRPAARHARASSRLGGELYRPFDRGTDGPGGWIILDEPELHLDGNVLVPDLAGWRRERMPEMPDAPAFELAPDWVCEVVSPGTAATDRAEKMPAYARASVRCVWLIDPAPRTLEVFGLDGGAWRVLGVFRDAARVRAEPFDAIELELARLWER